MGVYIDLAIMPIRITREAWLDVYNESLVLLQGYPGEMMGIQYEEINSAERRVYSRKIEHDVDDPGQKHWHVVGDFKSKQTGESFVFYSDLDNYRARKNFSESHADEDEDIIVSIVEEQHRHCHVFLDKTQGHPYHIPLLAVAMLVEDRFPEYAHASGNIDIYQARKAQQFARPILEREIALPICVDAPRLFEKICRHYEGMEAIEYFDQIFRGDHVDKFKALYQLIERETFIQYFLDELQHYSSPGQFGAIDLSIEWLTVTKDVKTLCELACLNEHGPRFDPIKFSEALASTWISIDESLRDIMKPFRKSEGDIDTVDTQLGSIIFDMGGLKGRNMTFYMDEKPVLEILSQLSPDNSRAIENAFKAGTEKIQKELTISGKGVQEFIRNSNKDPEAGDGSSFILLKSAEKLSERQEVMLQGIAYGLANAGPTLIEKYPEIFNQSSRQLREKIVRITYHQGLTFTEDAWKWIDRENDAELLKIILTLMLIDSHEQRFSNIRRGLLENRELCKAVLEMTHDKEMLAKIAEEIAVKDQLEDRLAICPTVSPLWLNKSQTPPCHQYPESYSPHHHQKQPQRSSPVPMPHKQDRDSGRRVPHLNKYIDKPAAGISSDPFG